MSIHIVYGGKGVEQRQHIPHASIILIGSIAVLLSVQNGHTRLCTLSRMKVTARPSSSARSAAVQVRGP